MPNNSKTLTLDGVQYEIRELSMRQILPLMEGQSQEGLGVALVKNSVHQGGKPLGDAALDLGFSTFQALMSAVNELHGVAEPKKT